MPGRAGRVIGQTTLVVVVLIACATSLTIGISRDSRAWDAARNAAHAHSILSGQD